MFKAISLTKRFGTVTALTNVSLEVASGEFVVVTGPSGAGKTTLVRCLSLADPFDSGEIFIADSPISKLTGSAIARLRRQIGVVHQDFKLLTRRSALDNVALPLQISGEHRRLVREKSMAILDVVGLADRASSNVETLSGGEQQRVAIARALVSDPLVIIADEPTGNLDARRSAEMIDLFDHATQRGVTVIIATHDPLVLQYANAMRLVELDQGEIVSEQCGVRDRGAHETWEPGTAPRRILQVVS